MQFSPHTYCTYKLQFDTLKQPMRHTCSLGGSVDAISAFIAFRVSLKVFFVTLPPLSIGRTGLFLCLHTSLLRAEQQNTTKRNPKTITLATRTKYDDSDSHEDNNNDNIDGGDGGNDDNFDGGDGGNHDNNYITK